MRNLLIVSLLRVITVYLLFHFSIQKVICTAWFIGSFLKQIRYPSSFLFIHDTFYIADYYTGMAEVVQQISEVPLTQLVDLSE